MIRRFSDLYEDVLRKSGFRHASVRPSYADHPYTCPFKIRMTRYCNGRHIPFYVPCGRCLYCQQHRADDWVTRQLCEASVSTQVFFTTLTYDDPHLEDISRYTLQCFSSVFVRLAWFFATSLWPNMVRRLAGLIVIFCFF